MRVTSKNAPQNATFGGLPAGRVAAFWRELAVRTEPSKVSSLCYNAIEASKSRVGGPQWYVAAGG